jgi:SagB-type dehydrogenase family enzyme
MVLESPRADTLFRLCDPGLASSIARLSIPRRVGDLAREGDPTAAEFLTLLVGSHFAFKIEPGNERNLRLAEGDPELVRWDFHDLLFHVQSTEGRHTNPIGAVYPLGITAAPLPALRPSWPGKKTDLAACPAPQDEPPIARLLRERHSTRSFDDRRPITIAQLAEFLNGAARVLPQHSGASVSEHAARPYPSAGGSWELELYLAVNLCDGLAQGFYHYDAGNHALVRIEIPAKEMKSLLMGAAGAMGVTSVPQVLFVIAARFGRISWKYSSIAYSLILKDVGVLTQTLYLMAEGMGLGGCAIGLSNIDQFEKMTGIEFYAEGPVGQFALGSKTTS